MGDVFMRSKDIELDSIILKTIERKVSVKYAQFISGSTDMKSLLQELIACRVDKRYSH